MCVYLWSFYSIRTARMLQKIFSAFSPYNSPFYPDVLSPFLLYSLLNHYTNVFYLYSLEFYPPWPLSNFLTHIDIPNDAHLSEDSKLISTFAGYYFNYVKLYCFCLCCICLIIWRCVVVSSCLPKAPDWSNKKLSGQYLGSRGMGKTSRQRE